MSQALSEEVIAFVQALRTEDLFKNQVSQKALIGEMFACAGCQTLSPEVISDTLGAVLKYQDDIAKIQGSEAKRILDEAKSGLAEASA